MRPTLIILARAPRIGTAKTRLARDIGPVPAWRINRRLNAHTLRVTTDPRWRTVLSVASVRDRSARLPGVWPESVTWIGQGRGHLGQRLEHLFHTAPRGPVAVIGTDCPGLHRADLAAAFAALKRHDVVVGPAEDGGFWLLGLSTRLAKRVSLAGVRWSHAETLADTLRALRPQRPAFLRTLADVDDAASLRRAYRAYRACRMSPPPASANRRSSAGR